MNRCLTEGRQAFARRLAGIQGGVECERFAPLPSALADGEASAEDLALLRPHMRTCLARRAPLKAFRTLPTRVAALVPPAVLVVAAAGPLRSWLESVLGGAQQKLEAALVATQQKAALVGERAQAVVELAAGQKLAAVAASAAALAGGGTAVDQLASHRARRSRGSIRSSASRREQGPSRRRCRSGPPRSRPHLSPPRSRRPSPLPTRRTHPHRRRRPLHRRHPRHRHLRPIPPTSSSPAWPRRPPPPRRPRSPPRAAPAREAEEAAAEAAGPASSPLETYTRRVFAFRWRALEYALEDTPDVGAASVRRVPLAGSAGEGSGEGGGCPPLGWISSIETRLLELA